MYEKIRKNDKNAKSAQIMSVPHVLSLFYALLAGLTLAVMAGMYWVFKIIVLYTLAGSVYVLYSLCMTAGLALAWCLKSALLFIGFVLHSIGSCAFSCCLGIFQVSIVKHRFILSSKLIGVCLIKHSIIILWQIKYNLSWL